MTSLPQALARAVGPANVYPAGYAVADWLDGRNPHTTATAAHYATMIRKALRQSNQPRPAGAAPNPVAPLSINSHV